MPLWTGTLIAQESVALLLNRVFEAQQLEARRLRAMSRAERKKYEAQKRREAEEREQARLAEIARKEREEAEMWLSIYSPGTEYDPEIHKLPEATCNCACHSDDW